MPDHLNATIIVAKDFALRPPLPSVVCGDTLQHDAFLRPLISTLLIGAHVLKLSLETRFTAAALLHRYYAATGTIAVDDSKDFSSYADQEKTERNYVVASCLFLACKREEEPRRLRDLVNFVHMIGWSKSPLNNNDKRDENRDASIAVIQWNPRPPDLDAAYWKSKERLVKTEQRVLRWLAFDVAVSRPQRAVVLLLDHNNTDSNHTSFLKALLINESNDDNFDNQCFQTLRRTALRWLNDTVYSAAALQQPVLPLAVAVITLALEEQQSIASTASVDPIARVAAVDDTRRWWKFVPVSAAQVEDALTILRRLQPS